MSWSELPLAALVLLVPIAVALALGAPLYVVILLDLVLSVVPGRWDVAGIFIDPGDVLLGALVVGMVLRARLRPRAGGVRVPYLALWFALGTLMSLSYLSSAETQEYLTGPLQIAYQLYRYCWKGLLYYPLCILLFDRADRIRKLIVAVVVVGVLFSIQAIPGGYAGLRGGPLLGGNALGVALHAPLLATLALLASENGRRTRILAATALLLIVRGITFSGSRGAFIGDLVGILVLLGLLFTLPAVRPRLARLGVVAAVLAVILLAVMPDLAERPTIRRFLTVTSEHQDEESTFTWRREQRWPHFWDRALARPWLGYGTDADPSLGTAAHTPHNGYLSIAVGYGFPALAIVLFFAWLGVRRSVQLFRRAEHRSGKIVGAVFASSLIALLVHNVVDNSLGLPFTLKVFWAFTGLAIVGARHLSIVEAPTEDAIEPEAARPVPAGAAGGRRAHA